uniref:Uncharacterized protein n=1 Tax=Rhinopithecus bieti TaxID=61621 RepID=A0A2K6N3Q0_RHIBE
MSHFCFHSLSRRLKKRSKPTCLWRKCDTCLEILVSKKKRHQDPTTARGGRSKTRTSPGSD